MRFAVVYEPEKRNHDGMHGKHMVGSYNGLPDGKPAAAFCKAQLVPVFGLFT